MLARPWGVSSGVATSGLRFLGAPPRYVRMQYAVYRSVHIPRELFCETYRPVPSFCEAAFPCWIGLSLPNQGERRSWLTPLPGAHRECAAGRGVPAICGRPMPSHLCLEIYSPRTLSPCLLYTLWITIFPAIVRRPFIFASLISDQPHVFAINISMIKKNWLMNMILTVDTIILEVLKEMFKVICRNFVIWI